MNDEGPAVFEVDPEASDRAMTTFLEWARPVESVRAFYTSDALVAIDSSECRGFILDEVYWATVWADRGSSALRSLLVERLDVAR